ncbi:hypothetical protein CEW46_29895, partial [Bacillus cereus]
QKPILLNERSLVMSSINDLINSTSLKEGMVVTTLGGTTINDGAGATYHIKQSTAVPDNKTVYNLLNNLQAHLVVDAVSTNVNDVMTKTITQILTKDNSGLTTFEHIDNIIKEGVYYVGPENGTPRGERYVMLVKRFWSDIRPCQFLMPYNASDNLGTNIQYRSWSSYNNKYNSFVDMITGNRTYVEEMHQDTFKRVLEQTTPNSVVIGAVTDTHYRSDTNFTYYGTNAEQHVQELNILDRMGILDVKAHLGDIVDGNTPPDKSRTGLSRCVAPFLESKTPFFVCRGNHDFNDKYNEDQSIKSADNVFREGDFSNIVWKAMYNQPQVNYISRKYGVGYLDKGNVRLLFINTSDIPYKVNPTTGDIVYNAKSLLAVRQGQVDEIIQILSQSINKNIIVFGHAPLVNTSGTGYLGYRGKQLHNIFKDFNRRVRNLNYTGTETDPEFNYKFSYDFTNNTTSKVSAYICGHVHEERGYVIDDIQYITMNISSLYNSNEFNSNFNRTIGTTTEDAGYVIIIDSELGKLKLVGYGASTPLREFNINTIVSPEPDDSSRDKIAPYIKKDFSIVSVKEFGAKGDGVSDDSTSIQATIDYVNSKGGGQVILPKGTYKMKNLSYLNLYSNIELKALPGTVTIDFSERTGNIASVYRYLVSAFGNFNNPISITKDVPIDQNIIELNTSSFKEGDLVIITSDDEWSELGSNFNAKNGEYSIVDEILSSTKLRLKS